MQIGGFLPQAVTDCVLLHAGAVAYHGGGIVLPAASHGGKSTLTLALFLREMDYYSDEVAVISMASGHLMPFPKPIASRTPDLHPALAGRRPLWFGPALQPDGPVWYAQAEDIRPGSLGQSVPIRYLVFPHYAPGQRAHLEVLPASAAMRALLANSVNFAALGGRALEALGRLARSARAYVLTSSDPEAAADLVAALN
jgi:hypothetical protein